MNFTLNNHLKYYINNNLYGFRESGIDKYRVEVGKIDYDYYKTSNWVQEQYRTADDVYKNLGKNLVVFFSGGTDSEIVLRTFKKIGLNPEVVFIKFKDSYNSQDLFFAEKIVKELNINLKIIDFDIIDFYKSGEAHQFASEIQCRQIAYLVVYYHIKKLQVPAVMGGEMMFQRKTSHNYAKWYYCFRENQDGSAMRFSKKYNIPLVNEWFSYTPEMMAYYLEHPKIKWLFEDRYNYKMASFSTKNEVLCNYLPELLYREKTHGYEELLAFNNETYISLHKSYVRRLEASLDGLYLEDLRKQLYGNNYEYSET